MIKPFNPETVHVYDNDGNLQFSDAYGLTVSQLSTVIEDLRSSQDNVAITEEDLVSYYHLQYPMELDVIRDMVGLHTEANPVFRDSDFAKGYFDNIDQILNTATTPTRMARIALRDPHVLRPTQFLEDVEGLVVLSHDEDERRNYILSLVPAESATMQYLGTEPEKYAHASSITHRIAVESSQNKKTIAVTTSDDKYKRKIQGIKVD